MTVLGSHVLLGLAVAGVVGAGGRLAARCADRGLLRTLATAVFACAIAALHALALGLAGLGGSAIALALAAAATWAAAAMLLPAPDPAPREELAAWWAGASPRTRMAFGALAVAAVGWAAWQLRYPAVGIDGLVYHLALPAEWVHDGSPGAVIQVISEVPFGNYPLTNELLLGWTLAISRSWVVASLSTPAAALLLGLATWVGLRAIGIARAPAGLAVAALLALPIVVAQLGGPVNDVTVVAWLAACGALCAASLDGRPALLAPALVAAGLAFGTKTTPALLLAILLAATGWHHRAALPALARPLALAGAAALAVGGVWAIRNLIEHGSPLWPFVATSFGDPLPPRLDEVNDRFLDHPGRMLEGRVDDYLLLLSGGGVLLVGAIVLPLVRRSRAALAAGGVTLLAILAWMTAPYTGITESTELAIGAARYLLPAIVAATLAVCLAGRGGARALRLAAAGTLALAAGLSVLRVSSFGFPVRPSAGTLIGLLALGAVGGRLLGRLTLPTSPWIAPAAAVVVGAALALAAPGYVDRHADVRLVDEGLMRALAAQPGFEDGDGDVAMGPATVALAGGDRLRHRVPLIGEGESCEAVRARRRQGWVVLQLEPPTDSYRRLAACLGGARPAWRDGFYELYAPLT